MTSGDLEFSFLVTYTTIPIMQDVTSVLMHKVPTNIDIDHVKNFLLDNQVEYRILNTTC